MKDQNSSFPWDLPWEAEDPESDERTSINECHGEDVHGAPWEPTLTIDEVSHLLDQMIMDIQHLELEVIRARYKLSFFLNHLMMNTFEWRYSAAWDHGMEGIQYTINICRTVA